MKHGIALIPKQEEIDVFIKYQKELKKLFPNLSIIFSVKTGLPHITLFQASFKDFDYKKIIDEISKEYLSKINKFKVKISDFQILNDIWLFLNLDDKDKLLQKLHHEVFKKIKDFIDLNNTDKKQTDYYSDKEKEYYRKYGYRFTDDLYIPHFTLGRIDDLSKQDKQKIKDYTNTFLTEKNLVKIRIDRICYHELGENGNCSNVIYSVVF